MDALVQHFRTTAIEQRTTDKNDLEYRYKARVGPIMTPEPEFGDVTQSAQLFNIDPQSTLLMTCKEYINGPVEEMQHHLATEFHQSAHEIFAKVLTTGKGGRRKEEREFIGAVEFEQLSKRLMDTFLNTVQQYCTGKLTPKLMDLMDNFIARTNESLVKEKQKISVKLMNARDACDEYRRTHERAMDHIKSEAIRITTNMTEDKFIADIKNLTKLKDDADYVNRLLTKKVDHFTAEMGKKDAIVHDSQLKAQKAHKSSLLAHKELNDLKHKQHNHIKDLNEKWQLKVDRIQDQLQDQIEKASRQALVKHDTKAVCIDSFTQTVEESTAVLPCDAVASNHEADDVKIDNQETKKYIEKIETLEVTVDRLKTELVRTNELYEKDVSNYQTDISNYKREISELHQSLQELQLSKKQIEAHSNPEVLSSEVPTAELALINQDGLMQEKKAKDIDPSIEDTKISAKSNQSENMETVHMSATTIETQTDEFPLVDRSTQTDESITHPKRPLEEYVGTPSDHESITQLIPDHQFRGGPSFDEKTPLTHTMESIDDVTFNISKYEMETTALVANMTNRIDENESTVAKSDIVDEKISSKGNDAPAIVLPLDVDDKTMKVLAPTTIAREKNNFAISESNDLNLSYTSADMNDEDDAVVDSLPSTEFKHVPPLVENHEIFSYVESQKSEASADYIELQKKFEKMHKDQDFQRYVIFSLEEQCKQQTTQIETLRALMEQNELVSKLKLRERGILLVELSSHINALRNQLIKGRFDYTTSNRPISTSNSTNALPKLSNDIDLPETPSSPAALKLLRDNTQSMPEIDVRPATVLNKTREQISDRRSTPKRRQQSIASTPDGPLHTKPFTAPIYNVKRPYSDFESMTVAPIATSPVKQVNFLRVGGGNTMSKRPNMFEASAGAQGKAKNVEGFSNSWIKEESSFYSDSKNDSMVEDTALSMSWLGIDSAKQTEIAEIRKEIVQKLTAVAKLKKTHMLATTKAAQLKGKGREIRVKLNKDVIPVV